MSFENITTVDGWSAALRELVDEARAAGDQTDRVDLSIRLTDYQIASRPPDPDDPEQQAAIAQFDRVARSVAEEVLIADIAERARAIARRAGELAEATKAFRQRATVNRRRAESIRLTPVKRVVVGANELIEAIGDVGSELGEGEDAEKLQAKLDRLVKAIQGVRDALETGVGVRERAPA